MAWSTPPTFTGGMIAGVAAALQKLSDDLTVLGGAWTADARSASSIWQAATNPAIGNGTLTSRYMSAGKLLVWSLRIVAGSTTTFGSGTWLLIPPFALKEASDAEMHGFAFDTSTGDNYPIWFQGISSTQLNGRSLVATSSTGPVKFAVLAAATPVAWGSGDTFTLHGTFELA